jgi:hypothetical protein
VEIDFQIHQLQLEMLDMVYMEVVGEVEVLVIQEENMVKAVMEEMV